MMICAELSLHSELILVQPSTPRSCASCSETISRSISCGLPPGQVVVMVIVGVSTSGVNCTGIRITAMMPNSITKMTPTETLTGL